MKDGEKALLALAAVGGYLYWSKKETKKTNIWTTGAGSSGSTFSTGPAAYEQKANVPNQRPLKVLTQKQGGKMIASWPEEKRKHFESLKFYQQRTAYLNSLGYTEGTS